MAPYRFRKARVDRQPARRWGFLPRGPQPISTPTSSGRLGIEPLEERRLLALDAALVRDLNLTTLSSSPSSFSQVGGLAFFAANDGTNGFELWKTDGTSSGTSLVKDINTGTNGSGPSYLINVGGTLYFRANDGTTGYELWKSDGTSTGTVLVKDIVAGVGSSGPRYLTNVGGMLCFQANDGTTGTELWKSDGTSTGTALVKDIRSGATSSLPRQLISVGGTLFFQANDGTTGTELWKSDGTSTGTLLVKDIIAGSGASGPAYMANVGGTVYFRASDSTNGQELWKSDGTSTGTLLVKDIRSGTSSSGPKNLTNVGGTLYFQANDGTTGYELWKSDGTSTGTVLVKDILVGTFGSFPRYLTNVGGTLYIQASDSTNGQELWKSDGTSTGTVLVKDINTGTGSSSPNSLTNVGGTLFFQANDGTTGTELWKSDGTSAGTVLVKDINTGTNSSSPVSLTNVGGTLFFTANDGTNGFELRKSDGTSAGTVLVKEINTGTNSSVPRYLTNVGGTLYFRANDGPNGYELWKSDGTSNGTVLVKDVLAGTSGSFPRYLTVVGGTLYFRANDGLNGYELWKSDGTSTGTVLVKDINTGTNSSSLYSLTNVGGTLYFQANDGVNGAELWKSDGTSAGTVLVSDILAGTFSSGPNSLTNVGGTLYFLASDSTNGQELWKSDGTSTGTVLVKDIRLGTSSSSPNSLTNVGGTLFFRANDGTTGIELWMSDGTSAGTVLVKDINTGTSSSSPNSLTNVGGTLYFQASDSTNGQELWKSNGTSTGTVLVKDINTGTSSSSPNSLTNVGGTLFFRADDGTTGIELWKSDATSAGTVLVKDVNTGTNSSSPVSLTYVGGTLFFTAHDGTTGYELWRTLQVAPVGNAGGPYTVAEGASLTLDASASYSPVAGASIVGYSWDLNGDNVFGDATGSSPRLTWTQLQALGIGDGPAMFNAKVRVTDSGGDTADSAATTLTITNAAPRVYSNGTLDPAFGTGGKVTTGFGSANDFANSVAIQTDGKIVVAGQVSNGGSYDFALARYNATGSLDPTFDGDGKLTTDFASSNDVIRGVAIQSDGKIVVAGYTNLGGTYDFALARYNADGSLDTTFDGDGKLTSPIGSADDFAFGIAIQSDGKIVVAGYSHNGSNYDFALARYNANGSFDTTFDGDGKLTTAIGSYDDVALSVAIQPDGKIVVAGYINNGSNYDFALARYNANGSLDTTFDGDGTLSTPFGSSHDIAQSLAIQSDGKLVVAGYSNNGSNEDFALARYNANGSLDTTFDGDGKVTTAIGAANDYANNVALQSDGKIVVVGQINTGSTYEFGLARYNANGSLDITFDGDGKLTTAIGSSGDAAQSVVIQLDGQLVVAGFSSNGSNNDFAVVRYNANGTLDTAFDADGKQTTNFPGTSEDIATGLVVQPDGKAVVAGYSNAAGTVDFTLTRYNVDGTLDTSFDGDGTVMTPIGTLDDYIYSAALQPDGKIVVAGYTNNGANFDFAIARYNTNGSLDTSFDGDGKVTTDFTAGSPDYARALALQPDGKIVVAGFTINGGLTDMAVARYNADGSLDLTFDADGRAVIQVVGPSLDDIAYGVAIQPDGKIVLAGFSGAAGSYSDLAVVRLNSDGSSDNSFSDDGRTADSFGGTFSVVYSVAIQPADGKIVVAGTTDDGLAVGLARFNTNGTLDNTFDGDGRVKTDVFAGAGNSDNARSLVVQPDGKLVLAGSSVVGGQYDILALRYNANGSLDGGFDGDGVFTTPVGASYDLGAAVALQGDGSLVVAGYSGNGSHSDFAVLRLAGQLSLSASNVNEGATVTVSVTSTPVDYATPDTSWGFYYGVDYENDGTIDTVGSSVAVPALDGGATPTTQTVRVRVLDKDGGYSDYLTSFTVNNVTPSADAGFPYTIAAGNGLPLIGRVYEPGVFDVPTFAWDINGDGVFTDAVGLTPIVSWATLVSLGISSTPATYSNVRLRVTDKDGAVGTSASTTLTVVNNAPIASAGGPYTVAEGDALTLNASGTTDADVIYGDVLSYTWDVNGDGVFGDATGVSPTLNWAQLQALGINDGPATIGNVQVRVTDLAGNVSTTAGTRLVKDIVAGAGSPASMGVFTSVNGTLFFLANDGVNGSELWKSDGTSAGTVLVKDIRPGALGSNPSYLLDVGGTLFFRANNGVNGYELWKSDGTSAGTVLVKDILPLTGSSFSRFLTNVGGTLFFQANDGVNGFELWKSDGTSAGTTLVKDVQSGAVESFPYALVNVGGTLYFAASDGVNGPELWKSNGTSTGTVLVKDIRPGANGSNTLSPVNVNGTLFFGANDGSNGLELWKSDGTSSGTVMVKDIQAGPNSSGGQFLTNLGGLLLFQATDGVNGRELWKSDGTSAGTVLVKDIRSGATSSYPASFTNVGGTLYFQANDGVNGYELWKSNGTSAGTVLVRDVRAGVIGSALDSLTNLGGTLYFGADDGLNGFELWKSDGTSAGTVLVKDISPGILNSVPVLLTNVNGTLYFRANDSVNGAELWASSPDPASLTVTNTAPTASAGGPYTVAEGASVSLTATASDPAGALDPLSYSWDLNGDNVFGDATGVAPTLTWAQLQALGINDGPAAFNNVRVRVDDGDGGITTSAATSLSVTNTIPTAGSFTNTGPVALGAPVSVSFAGSSDPSSADTTAGFTYRYDFNNDGDFTDLGDVNGTASAAAAFTYLTAGSKTVRGRIEDKDGGFTDYFTTLDVIAAPHVTNVSVKGAAWAIPAYSIPVGSSAQTAPLPWTNLDTISITFDADVDIQQNDLAIRGLNVAIYSTSGFSYVSATKTATWTLGAPIGIDKLILDLAGTGGDPVRELVLNQALDGEWLNNSTSYPSGNGAAGGDFEFRFNVLPGDVNQSGGVLGNDVILTRNAQFTSYGGPGYSIFKDVNGSGTINGGDVVAVQNRQFTVLPPGTPSTPAPQPPLSEGGIVAAPVLTAATAGTKFDVAWRVSQAAQAHERALASGDFWTSQVDDELTSLLTARLTRKKSA